MKEPQDIRPEPPFWSEAFHAYRAKLLSLAALRLQDVLKARFSPEDVVSAAYEECLKREDYLAAHPEVPLYNKFCLILSQTLTDIERKNLLAKKRDAYKDIPIAAPPKEAPSETDCSRTDFLAAPNPAPVSQIAQKERNQLLSAALRTLSDTDQQILRLRHFKGLRNEECAEKLGIDPKAASIRYVRALERLHRKLMKLSCFRLEHPPKKDAHGT